MSSGRFPALLVGALAVIVAAGCGGGGGNNTTTGSIGKAAFIKKANAICEKGQKKLRSDSEALINESSAQAEEEWVYKVIVPNVKRQVSEIRALGTPSGDEGRIEAVLAAIESGLHGLEEKPEEVLASSAETFSEAIKLATKYGLTACAQTF